MYRKIMYYYVRDTRLKTKLKALIIVIHDFP